MASWLDDLDGVLSRSKALERPFHNGKSGQVATLNQGQREEARDERTRGKAARSREQVFASSQRERGKESARKSYRQRLNSRKSASQQPQRKSHDRSSRSKMSPSSSKISGADETESKSELARSLQKERSRNMRLQTKNYDLERKLTSLRNVIAASGMEIEIKDESRAGSQKSSPAEGRVSSPQSPSFSGRRRSPLRTSQSPTLAAKSPPAESYFLRNVGRDGWSPETEAGNAKDKQRLRNLMAKLRESERALEKEQRQHKATRDKLYSAQQRCANLIVVLSKAAEAVPSLREQADAALDDELASTGHAAEVHRFIAKFRSGQSKGALVEDLIQQHVLEEQQAQRMAMRMRRLREKRYASNTNDGEEAEGGKSSTSEEETRGLQSADATAEGSSMDLGGGNLQQAGVDEMDVTSRKPVMDEMLVPKAVRRALSNGAHFLSRGNASDANGGDSEEGRAHTQYGDGMNGGRSMLRAKREQTQNDDDDDEEEEGQGEEDLIPIQQLPVPVGFRMSSVSKNMTPESQKGREFARSVRDFMKNQRTSSSRPHRFALARKSVQNVELTSTKSKEVHRVLTKAMRKEKIFDTLDEDTFEAVLASMTRHVFKAGEVMLAMSRLENDRKTLLDSFIVIQTGTAQLFQRLPGSGALLVDVLSPGKFWGAHHLRNEAFHLPGEMTVSARTNVVVWALSSDAYSGILSSRALQQEKEIEGVIERVPILSHLDAEQRSQLVAALEEKKYIDGQAICKQGQTGSSFFIVKSGVVMVTKKYTNVGAQEGDESAEEHIASGSRGYFFGERALLNEKSGLREATVRAHGPARCLALARKDFTRLLGPLQKQLQKKRANEGMMQPRSRKSILHSRNESKNIAMDLSAISKSLHSQSASSSDEGSEVERRKIRKFKMEKEYFACKSITRDHLKHSGWVGLGSMARLALVSWKRTGGCFVLKEVRQKWLLASRDLARSIRQERDILAEITYAKSDDEVDVEGRKFIIKLYQTLSDDESFGLILDYCPGGDLLTRLHMSKSGFLSDFHGRFVCAGIVKALQCLHSRHIMYRDLKPENILLDAQGYPKLCDFNNAKKAIRSWTMCGTMAYISPEQLLCKGHDASVDLWALGVLIMEMLTGASPFDSRNASASANGSSAQSQYERILNAQFNCSNILGDHATDLVKKLIHVKPKNRLGNSLEKEQDILQHDWLKDWPWESYLGRKIDSPFTVIVASAHSTDNFYAITDEEAEEFTPAGAHPDNRANVGDGEILRSINEVQELLKGF